MNLMLTDTPVRKRPVETTVRHLLDHEDKTWTTLRCVSHYLTGSILFYRYQENKNMNYIWMRHSIKLKDYWKVDRVLKTKFK